MKYDIEVLKRKLLVKYPFFGCVIANIKYKEVLNIKTAGTDGKIIYYNPGFLVTLELEQQIFILAHEVFHIALDHILRSEGKDKETWNIATDAVINAYLVQDGLKMVKGGIDIKDAINYDAEELYEKLLKEKQEKNQNKIKINFPDIDKINQNSPQNDIEGKGNEKSEKSKNNEQKTQDVGHDTHSMWEDSIKEHKREQKIREIKDKFLDRFHNKKNRKEKNEIKKKQDECVLLGEKKVFNKNIEEKKKELEELKKILSRENYNAGSDTDRNVRNVSNIGKSKSIIDWRYLLKEAVKLEVDWSYRNATIEDGVVTANLEEQLMPETEIVLDTSGSINETLLKNFLRQCKNILDCSKLKVGCFDTEFYGFVDIRTEEDIDKMEFVGGGGTDFNVAVNAFTERVPNKIIFTDGCASMPKKEIDAIWIVFSGKTIIPKGGKVIQIDKAALNKLYSFKQESFCRIRKK